MGEACASCSTAPEVNITGDPGDKCLSAVDLDLTEVAGTLLGKPCQTGGGDATHPGLIALIAGATILDADHGNVTVTVDGVDDDLTLAAIIHGKGEGAEWFLCQTGGGGGGDQSGGGEELLEHWVCPFG